MNFSLEQSVHVLTPIAARLALIDGNVCIKLELHPHSMATKNPVEAPYKTRSCLRQRCRD